MNGSVTAMLKWTKGRQTNLDSAATVAARFTDANVINFQQNNVTERHNDMLTKIDIWRQCLRIVQMIQDAIGSVRQYNAALLHMTICDSKTKQIKQKEKHINTHNKLSEGSAFCVTLSLAQNRHTEWSSKKLMKFTHMFCMWTEIRCPLAWRQWQSERWCDSDSWRKCHRSIVAISGMAQMVRVPNRFPNDCHAPDRTNGIPAEFFCRPPHKWNTCNSNCWAMHAGNSDLICCSHRRWTCTFWLGSRPMVRPAMWVHSLTLTPSNHYGNWSEPYSMHWRNWSASYWIHVCHTSERMAETMALRQFDVLLTTIVCCRCCCSVCVDANVCRHHFRWHNRRQWNCQFHSNRQLPPSAMTMAIRPFPNCSRNSRHLRCWENRTSNRFVLPNRFCWIRWPDAFYPDLSTSSSNWCSADTNWGNLRMKWKEEKETENPISKPIRIEINRNEKILLGDERWPSVPVIVRFTTFMWT